MPSKLSPGQGVECVDCSHITETNDVTAPCEDCDGTNTTPVVIQKCPYEDPNECSNEFHHWGYGVHVLEGTKEELGIEDDDEDNADTE